MNRALKKYYRHVRMLWWTRVWYKITMFFTRQKNVKLTKYNKVAEIPAALNWGNDWRADPFNGKMDVQYHPTYVQKWVNSPKVAKHQDCDDFAAYWAASLLHSNLASKVWLGFVYMRNRETGKFSGHAVCVYLDLGRYYWCDYDLPRMFAISPQDRWVFARQVVEGYNADLVSCALMEVRGLTKSSGIKYGKYDYFIPS